MPSGPMLWAYAVLAVTLVIAAVTDVRSGKIYNVVTYPAIAIGLVGHTVLGGLMGDGEYPMGLAGSAAGFAVGFLPMLLVWLAGGINGGDAKLMGAVGALAGMRFALSALFYGLAVAALMAVIVMIYRRMTLAVLGRVWRFVLLSVVSRGKAPGPATATSPKVALGLALCLGSAVALVVEVFIPQGKQLLDLII